MRRTRSRVRGAGAVTGAVAAALLLVGCGSGPSQAGAAAIVGDVRVPVDQVQQQLEDVLAKEGDEAKAQLVSEGQLDDVSRQIVTLRVRHELTAAAAERAGITVDEQQVTELVESLGGAQEASAGTVFDAAGFRDRARDQLIAVELGRRALPGLAVTVDYTTATTRAEAQERVRELADAGAEGARALVRADADAGLEAAVGERIEAQANPSFASAPVFGVEAGTVLGFPADESAASWLVMVVTERTEGTGPAAAEVDPAAAEAVGIRQLAPVAADLGVRVSPRYGVWDPLTLQAAPGEDETGGFTAPLRDTPAA